MPIPSNDGAKSHGALHHRAGALAAVLCLAALLSLSVTPSQATTAHSGIPQSPSSLLLGAPRAITPAGTLGALFVTVANPSATPTGTYNQQVDVDSASYANFINSNWTNGEALYLGNATPIYTWIEANASNSSSHTVLWLRLYSIPAEGQVTVALRFDAKSAFLLSEDGYTGENPLLSSSYGEFDNGWRVFNFYDNFTGSSLSSAWTTSGSWTYAVSDGISITGIPGNGGYISSTVSFPYPEAVDFYGNLFESSSGTAFMDEGIGTSACTGCADAATIGYDAGGGGAFAGPSPMVGVGSNAAYGSPMFSSQQFAIFSAVTTATGAEFQANYTQDQNVLGTLPSSPQPVGLAMSAHPSGSTTNTETTYWIRERGVANASVVSVQAFAGESVSLTAYPGTLEVNQSLTLVTSVGGVPAFSYMYSGLPLGCTSKDSSTLSCVVRAAGQFTPAVVISNGLGDTLTTSTNVTVTLPSSSTGPAPLQVTLAAVPEDVPVNQVLTLIASPSGGTAPYAFSYAGLPSGCSSKNQSFLSCAPDVLGSFTVTVSVTDSAATTVTASAGIVVFGITPTPPPPLQVDLTSYSGSLSAGTPLVLVATVTGGEGPFSFNYTGLPGGCSSANASSLVCTPTQSGQFTIVVTVTDPASQSQSASTSLTIASVGTGTTTTPESGPSTELVEAVAAGAAVALVVGAVALARTFGSGQRKSGPPPGGA